MTLPAWLLECCLSLLRICQSYPRIGREIMTRDEEIRTTQTTKESYMTSSGTALGANSKTLDVGCCVVVP